MREFIENRQSLEYAKHFPWANAHIARLALSNGSNLNRMDATPSDLIAFKNAYHALDPHDEPGDVWSMMTRMVHEQLPHQTNPAMEVGRSWLLYGEPLTGCQSYAWAEVFGMPLDRRMRGVMLLWGSVLAGSGRFHPDTIVDALANDPRVSPQLLSDVPTIVEDLTLTPAQFRATYYAAWEPRRTPALTDWNPLDRHPLVSLPDGTIVAPSVPHLLRTVQSESIYYRGIDHWGESFARDLGPRVEAVAGFDLELLDDANLIREISYRDGKATSKSVDWIVVFPECVLLIECKSARLTVKAIQDIEVEERELKRHVGKAATQLSRSAQAIAEGVPEFQEIPNDRPVYGLVVTAEHIPLANAGHGRFAFASDIPFEVLPLRELSDFCMADLDHPGEYIHTYFQSRDPLDPHFGQRLPPGTTRSVHRRLQAAWNKAMGKLGAD